MQTNKKVRMYYVDLVMGIDIKKNKNKQKIAYFAFHFNRRSKILNLIFSLILFFAP